MTNHISFSNFSAQEHDAISELLCCIFNTTQLDIEKIYKEIKDDFSQDGWPPHSVGRNFFRSEDSEFNDIYNKSPSRAVDLPSLFELNDGVKSKPTIVILGQDSKSDQDSEGIIVGTPYGLHHKGSREVLKKTKLYFDMVYALVELGYRVYLTDIYKIWVCDPNNPYNGIQLPRADQNKHLGVLKPELLAVNPVAIVTWGQQPAHGVSKISLDIPHLAFPHPSSAANGAWRRLMNQPATIDNKLAYWKSTISKSLAIGQ